MKGTALILIMLALAGCAKSKFAADPRAAMIGPAYLDYIAENPRDRDTQYYLPVFTLRGLTNWVDPSSSLPPSPYPSIDALLIDVPDTPPAVVAITGEGYPSLERTGLLLFTRPRP